MSDKDETAELLAGIAGGAELLALDGGFSFHDAEVRRIVLDRAGPSAIEIELMWPARLLVTFVLGDWIDIDIRGFSHQNVTSGLTLARAGERDVAAWELGVGLKPGTTVIELDPCFGAYGTTRATILRIELSRLPTGKKRR